MMHAISGCSYVNIDEFTLEAAAPGDLDMSILSTSIIAIPGNMRKTNTTPRWP